jgi:hypothetical protein
MTLIRLEA